MRLALVSLLVVAACGDNDKPELPWGIGLATFDARELGIAGADTVPAPAWFNFLEDRPMLDTPTYDGESQATHPDVLVEDDRALLALTPYPFGNARHENPSLLVASDGMTFAPFPGAPSPLVPAPPVDHNDDPDLRIDPITGEYELLYLDTERPNNVQTMAALRSTDLMTWTRRDAIVWDFTAGAEFIVSPTAIVDDAGTTHIFWVNTGNGVLETSTSADGMTWDQASVAPIAFDAPLGDVTPWHVDVLRAGAGYALLISAYTPEPGFSHQDIYLALSPDLSTWTLRPTPLLSHTALGLSTMYRSTGHVAGGRLAVWYAMQYYL